MEELAPYIGPILSAALAFAGSYLALTNRITRLETKMDVLSERVEKHNNVSERTMRLEADMDNLYHRVDDLKPKERSNER